MSSPPFLRPIFCDDISRRHLLAVGAMLVGAGCLDETAGDPPTGDNSDNRTTSTADRPHEESEDDYPTGYDDHEDDIDEDEESNDHPADDLDFQGFTHFPADFAVFFRDLTPDLLEADQPIVPFFSDQKVVGAGKWYLINPHDDAPIDHEWGMRHSDWPIYLVADAVVSLGHLDREPAAEVNDEPVYLEFGIDVYVHPDVRVLYDKFRLRKSIADAILEAGGEVILPAGTHLGYGLNAFGVFDERVDIGVMMHPGVNPFEYFIDDKQTELLDHYQSAYDIFVDEGTRPFTDLTDGRLEWDVPGALPGGWIRDVDIRDVEYNGDIREEYFEVVDWSLLSLFPTEVLNEETYWRVIDHPWNRANGFMGVFSETERLAPSDTPLYDGDPIGRSRFYLLDGDLSGGVAMIISQWEWRPLKADSDSNHPLVGERRYLRFSIDHREDGERDALTIQGFTSEEEAATGFTDEAVLYRRLRG